MVRVDKDDLPGESVSFVTSSAVLAATFCLFARVWSRRFILFLCVVTLSRQVPFDSTSSPGWRTAAPQPGPVGDHGFASVRWGVWLVEQQRVHSSPPRFITF